MLHLPWCSGFSLALESRGYSLVMALRCLTVVASLVEHRLWRTGSVVGVHELSSSTVCGIFPDQGLNPWLLNWPADCLPLGLYYILESAHIRWTLLCPKTGWDFPSHLWDTAPLLSLWKHMSRVWSRFPTLSLASSRVLSRNKYCWLNEGIHEFRMPALENVKERDDDQPSGPHLGNHWS